MRLPHVDSRDVQIWFRRTSYLVFALWACGPALTDPSPNPVSGRWTTTDHIGPVYNVQIDLTQQANGSVKGTWTADVSPPNPPCPPGLSAHTNGTVTGSATVLEVRLSFDGIGDFSGQSLDDGTLHGSVYSCGVFYPVTFSSVGPVPGG